jgi:hypothetical protein
MKNSFILPTFAVVIITAMICLSSPLFGYGDDETAMLNKAYDLVHQAWNPGDDPPSDTERTDLLNQALKLAQDAPQHNVKGHRVKAILEIKAALALIKAGDADHQAVEHIHQAADELRTALSIAE